MNDVNAELSPWMRMTAPPAHVHTPLDQAPTATLLFHSWVLFCGVLPIDRHAFELLCVEPGQGFIESSSSWTERSWVHKRRLISEAEGCLVEDILTFEPRFTWTAPLLRAIVRIVFRHRHARLHGLFGAPKAGSS